MKVSPEALWEAYQARRDVRAAALGERVDVWFQNYCKNWVMRDWYLFAPSLAQHVQNLLARVAVLRFLLLSDPRLVEALAITDGEARARRCDALAVEVFYAFARTVEHSDAFLAAITASLEQFSTVAHAICLLRF